MSSQVKLNPKPEAKHNELKHDGYSAGTQMVNHLLLITNQPINHALQFFTFHLSYCPLLVSFEKCQFANLSCLWIVQTYEHSQFLLRNSRRVRYNKSDLSDKVPVFYYKFENINL